MNAQVNMPTDSVKTGRDTITVDTIPVSQGSENEIKSPITYSSKDSMMFSVKSKRILAYGEGKLAMEEMNLESGYIEMNMDSNYLFAKAMIDKDGKEVGNPVYKQGTEKYEIKTFKYNTKTKKALVSDIVTEMGGGYMQARITKMMPNGEINLFDGKYSTCDAKHPHFYIQLTKAKVIPDQAIISGPFYFVISDIKLPLGLPFGYFPSQNTHHSGIIIPSYGEEKRRGFYLQRGGYYFALSDYVDLTLLGDIYTSGSWGLNLSSNYRKRYKYSGSLNLSFNQVVQGEKDIENDYSKSSMFSLRANYNRDSKAMPNASFNASINLESSKNRQYTTSYQNGMNDPSNFARNNTSSSIAYTRDWPETPFHFSINASANQNLTDSIISLQIPTISLSMNTQHPFKGKNSGGKTNWYREISVGFSSNIQNSLDNIKSYDLFTNETAKKMKNGMQYRVPISTSMKLLKYLNLSPSFNYNGRVYTKNSIIDTLDSGLDTTITNDGFFHVYDFSFSAPISTKLYGIKNFKRGKIAAIRHVVSPSVSFSYTPDFAAEKWNYYEWNPHYPKDPNHPENYSKRYSKYVNGIYGSPPSGKNGSVGFSLGNNFEMKTHTGDTAEPEKKIVLLNSLNFSTSYNMAADSLKWAPVSISADTKLFKQVNVNYNGTYEIYDQDPLTGNLKNSFRFKNKNTKGFGWFKSHSINLSGSISSETFKKKKEDDTKNPADESSTAKPDDDLIKNAKTDEVDKEKEDKEKTTEGEYSFKIPWNMSINYSLNLNNQYDGQLKSFNTKIVQTISLNGDLSLTQKWKVNGSMSYDFDAHKIAYTSMGISRDLHCWQMSFNFVPFGTYQSYNFKINVKSAMLQGLEYKKQQSFVDNLY